MNFGLMDRVSGGFFRYGVMSATRWHAIVAGFVLLTNPLVSELRLTPVSIEAFLASPEAESVLEFELEGSSPPQSLQYRIREYDGSERYRSSVAVEDGRISVTLDPRPGYREVYFPLTDQIFGVGEAAGVSGARDPFFGIDAGLSWLAEEDIREALIANLARGGIGMARERVDWRALNPRRGNWNWHARETWFHPYPGGYERARITYGQHDIKVVDPIFHVPEWMRRSQNAFAFPTDLGAMAEGMRTIGSQWSSYHGGIEAWNRPDLDFGRYLPADQYVPLVKAARVGFEQGGINTPLGGGGFAALNRPYLDLAARNGLLDHVDYVSFRFSGDPVWMEDLVASVRSWLEDFGYDAMPVWITESGASMAGLEGRPEGQIERVRAMRYVMNAVEAKATGVKRHFPSLYSQPGVSTPHTSMTDEFGVPLRSLIAYFHAVQALSHRTYAGDLDLSPGTLKRVRAFAREGQDTVIVLYNGHPAWTQSIRMPFQVTRARGIDGRELRVTEGRSVTISDGLIYVWASAADVESFLNNDTRAAGLFSQASGRMPERPPVSQIVLQPTPGFGENAFASQVGYFVAAGANRFLLPVRIHNLGENPVELELEAREASRPGDVVSLGRNRVMVPANSHRDLSFDFSVSRLRPREGTAVVEVVELADRPTVSPLAVNILTQGALEEVAGRYEESQRLVLRDMERRAVLSTTEGVDGATLLVTRDGYLRISAGFSEAGTSALSLDLPMPRNVTWNGVEAVALRIRFERPGLARLGIRTEYGTVHSAVNRMIKRDGEWGVFVFPLDTDHFQDLHGMTGRQADLMRNGLQPLERISLEFIHLDEDRSGNVVEIGDMLLLGGRRSSVN